MRRLGLALVVCTAIGCGGTGGGAGGGGTAGSGGGAAAGGGSGGSAGGGSGGGSGVGGGTGGSGGGTTSTAPSCTVAEDCPYWYCDCKSGPPVNSRRCINNRCVDGASSCGSACANFGTCWLGISSGGFPGGSNAGPSTCPSGTGGGAGGGGGTGGSGGSGGTCPFSDLGKGCSGASSCQSQLCFGSNPSFECTKACTTANDCPYNWTCDPATGGGKVCTQGSLTGTKSTSSVCSAIAYTDVGGPCTTACKSGFCTSTNICTRRCNVSSDCPSTWTCTAGASFKLCIP